MSVRVLFSPVVNILNAARRAQNQIMPLGMIGTNAHRSDTVVAAPGAASAASVGVVFPVLAMLVAAGLGALALVTTGAADSILFVLLWLFGVLGIFLVLGYGTGLIHIGAPPEASDTGIITKAADNIAAGLLVTERDGTITYANAAWRRVAGVDEKGNVRGLELAFAGEPQAAECLFRLIRAAELGEVRSEEFRVRDLGSRERAARWLRLTVRPLPAATGAADGTSSSLWQLEDISRDRAHEAELVRELEADIARYEAMPVGLLSASLDGEISHLNSTLAGWLGLDAAAADARRLTLANIVAGDGDAMLRAALDQAAGEVVRLELQLVREDGVGLPVEVVARLRSTGDRGVGISAFVLSRSSLGTGARGAGGDARYERLFQSAPFGIATLGTDGSILSFNAAFARMFFDAGLDARGDLSALLAAAGDAEATKAVAAALEKAREGHATLAPIEVSFGREQKFTRRLYVSPLHEGVGAGEAVMLYAIDATEQRALEMKYAQSQKMEAVGKLAGGIAHDFNNVLTAIIGFSDLLLQTHRPVDPAHKDILNIKLAANRAANLVRQLLAYSRRQTLSPTVLDLDEVLVDLSVLLNRLIGEKIGLKLISGRDLWQVKADRTQFDQVMMNLASNARDAMPSGGRLTIRTQNVSERESMALASLSVAPGEYVLVEVEDTGTGMTPEVMLKVFEPFFSTKEVGKGTGLGLATVYGIVKQTGGYIFPESTPGKGTTFKLYLPRHVPEPVKESAPVEPVPAAQAAPKRDLTGSGRVLLVEDEDHVRDFTTRALKRQGYTVLQASTGVEALDVIAAEATPVDIVVSDVVMPEMDGPTMMSELRKARPDLKVIFMSGYPDDRFKNMLDPDAQFAFLPKPFTLAQLAAKVKEVLAE